MNQQFEKAKSDKDNLENTESLERRVEAISEENRYLTNSINFIRALSSATDLWKFGEILVRMAIEGCNSDYAVLLDNQLNEISRVGKEPTEKRDIKLSLDEIDYGSLKIGYDSGISDESSIALFKAWYIPIIAGKIRDLENISNLQSQIVLDSLTKLYNRMGILQVLERFHERRTHYTLFFIDLNNFKEVNDSLGHNTGDFALKEASKLLRQNSRGTDELARYGGDEFIIVLPQTDLPNAENVAHKLIDAFTENCFTYSGCKFKLGLSIGGAFYDGTDFTPREIILKADTLMYVAKKSKPLSVYVSQIN